MDLRVSASLPAVSPASLKPYDLSWLFSKPQLHCPPSPTSQASCPSHWIDCDVAHCSMAKRPQVAFALVPVNPFWLHTCRDVALL